jgi:hypothetical protein
MTMHIPPVSFKDHGLSPALFWDMDLTKIDMHKHSRIVIERVMIHGTLAEFKSILQFYGRPTIRETVTSLRHLDDRTLSFCCAFFHLEKSDFRCYTSGRLNHAHWKY